MNKVNIYGKDYEFYLSVRASKEISKLCSGGLFENFERDLQMKDDAEKFDFLAKVVIILNKSAIMKRHFENGEPIGSWEHIDSISEDMIDCMEPNEFVDKVYLPALATLVGDMTQEIEVEPDSKNAETQPA